MGLSSAIANAVTGLRATQAGMDVVSQNVANSGTAGYTRRVLNTTELYAGNQGAGVRVVGAQRVLDTLVQRQLRLENSGASYTGVKAEFHAALDGLFDAPGSATGASGAPTYGLNGSSIAGGSVEASNTDISDEFSKMIVTQQAYSANTRVLTTAQTMLQDILNVIR